MDPQSPTRSDTEQFVDDVAKGYRSPVRGITNQAVSEATSALAIVLFANTSDNNAPLNSPAGRQQAAASLQTLAQQADQLMPRAAELLLADNPSQLALVQQHVLNPENMNHFKRYLEIAAKDAQASFQQDGKTTYYQASGVAQLSNAQLQTETDRGPVVQTPASPAVKNDNSLKV